MRGNGERRGQRKLVRVAAGCLVAAAVGCGGSKPLNHFVYTSATGGSSGGGTGGGGGGTANPLASCGQLEPCGGNLVGSWNLVGGCVNDAALGASAMIPNCSGVTVDVANFTVSGAFSFAADMTYSAAGATESFTMTENIPSSCLNGATCADLSDVIRLNAATDPTPGISFVSCTGTTTCACRLDAALVLMGETGRYTISGNSVITTPTGKPTDDPTDYCVQGSQFHLIDLDTTMHNGPMGQATITVDIVAQKQSTGT